MLRWRLTVAALIILPVALLLWLDDQWNWGRPGIWLTAVTMLIAALICKELVDLLRRNSAQPSVWPAYFGSLTLVLAAAAPNLLAPAHMDTSPIGRWGWAFLSLVLTLALTMLVEMYWFSPARHATVRIALTLLVVVYGGGLLSFLLATRLLYPNRWGLVAIFSVMFVTKVADTGAYFSGRSVGRHKLAPLLSPAKTVEGALGGVVAACAASWVVFAVFVPRVFGFATPKVSWWVACAYGLSLALAGIAGDLAESLLKRDLGRKDSSGWLPGLGGVLDVVDSVLFAAPVGFLWWAAGWLHGRA